MEHSAATSELIDSEDLNCDVVWAAPIFGRLDQGVADFCSGFPGDCGLDLAFSKQSPEAVGAEHQYIACFKRNGLGRGIGSDAIACSQGSRKDMALGMRLGLLGAEDTVLNQAADVASDPE